MPHIVADRVLESTVTTGTGDITLDAAITGFRRFNAACAVGDTVSYFIEAIDSQGLPTGDYEYGTGTYSAANTLTRTTVLGSSNGGALVNFTTGSKNVGISLLSDQFAFSKTANGYQKLPGGLILQWGHSTTSVTPGTLTQVTFPIAFPTACVSVTGGNRSTSNAVGLYMGGETTTKFDTGSNAASIAFSWMALGY